MEENTQNEILDIETVDDRGKVSAHVSDAGSTSAHPASSTDPAKGKRKGEDSTITKKKPGEKTKGSSKRRKLSSKTDMISPLADDAARAAIYASDHVESSDEDAGEDEDSDDSESGGDSDPSSPESSDDEEGPTPVVPPKTVKSSKSTYSRFNPGEGDAVTFDLPNADMAEYATNLFTRYVNDKKLRETICDPCPIPRGVPGLEVPDMDEYIIDIFSARKQDYGRYTDENWSKVQARILDVMGPLSKVWSILDTARLEDDCEELDLFECLDLVEKSITLVGQSFLRVSHYRQQGALFKLTKDMKKVKQLLKKLDPSTKKSHSKLFGKAFYKQLNKSAKIKKASKEISSQFGEGKQKSKPRGSKKQDQPFQAGPSPNTQGGGRKVAFHKRGKGSGNRGKFLIKFSVCNKAYIYPDRRTGLNNKCTRKYSQKCRLYKGYGTVRSQGLSRSVEYNKPALPTSEPVIQTSAVARKSGGETPLVHPQLGEDILGSLHSPSGEGIQDSLCQPASSGERTSSLSTEQRGVSISGRGDKEYAPERSNLRGGGSGGAVCESTVLGSQERWDSTSCDQSEKTERICSVRTFQDGGDSPPERSVTTTGLHDQSRSEGRLFQCPNAQGPPSVSEISVGEIPVSVQLHALRAGTSPKGIHEDNEANCGTVETNGSSSHHLSGRHYIVEPDQRGIGEGLQLSTILADAIRVCNQLEEVLPDSDPDLRILGFYNQYPNYDYVPTRGQSDQGHCKVQTDDYKEICQGQTFVRNDRAVDCFSESNPASPSTLPSNANDSSQGTPCGTVIRDLSNSIPRGPPGITLVDREYPELEWESNCHSLSRYDHRNRRIFDRMGSCLGRTPDRGSLGSGGKGAPHQCPGIKGSTICSAFLRQGLPQNTCPSEDGQCISCDLHPEDGWDQVKTVVEGSSSFMGLLLGEGDPSFSRVPPRSPECSGRLGIEEFLRSQRLETGRIPVQSLEPEMGSFANRFICKPTQCPTETLCQLETGPLCRGSGRLSAELGNIKSLSVSSLCSDTSVSSKGLQGQGHGSHSNTDMAVSTVVSHIVRDVCGQPSVAPSIPGLTKVPKRRNSSLNRSRATPSGVESVRDQALARGVSREAANLLAEHSWRRGTASALESAWGQWSRWCLPRKIDPLCSSVESVVNYLTDNYNRGDQYNTLNLHRSAISAFHNLVDNMKVGQHPTVTAIMSAFFNTRPPMPRYQYTWEVDGVLEYIISLGDNGELALKQLTYKLTMLLALACAGRSSDLHAFDIRFMNLDEEKVIFNLAKLTKSRKKGSSPLKIELHKLEENPRLCVLSTLESYLERTKNIRDRKDVSRSQLLLSFVEPHKAVVSCTIAGWLVKFMTQAGVDTEVFKGHSTRGASTSKAAALGLSCKEILTMAKWKKKATFYKHYHRQVAVSVNKTKTFEDTVLGVSL